MNEDILFYNNYGEVGYDKVADHYFWRLDDHESLEMSGYKTLEDAMIDYHEECEKYTVRI